MEIDITEFVANECPRDFSASVAEIGNDAGRQTWAATMETAPDYPAQTFARSVFGDFVK